MTIITDNALRETNEKNRKFFKNQKKIKTFYRNGKYKRLAKKKARKILKRVIQIHIRIQHAIKVTLQISGANQSIDCDIYMLRHNFSGRIHSVAKVDVSNRAGKQAAGYLLNTFCSLSYHVNLLPLKSDRLSSNPSFPNCQLLFLGKFLTVSNPISLS